MKLIKPRGLNCGYTVRHFQLSFVMHAIICCVCRERDIRPLGLWPSSTMGNLAERGGWRRTSHATELTCSSSFNLCGKSYWTKTTTTSKQLNSFLLLHPGCPRPNSALTVHKSGLKHRSSIHPSSSFNLYGKSHWTRTTTTSKPCNRTNSTLLLEQTTPVMYYCHNSNIPVRKERRRQC